MKSNKQLLKFIHCEYLRLKEESGIVVPDHAEVSNVSTFRAGDIDKMIVERADRLLSQSERNDIDKIFGSYRGIVSALLLLFVFFGGFATVQVFSGIQQTAANFFTLLLGLLGVNAVSLLIWLIFLAAPSRSATGGSWIKSLHDLISRLSRQESNTILAWKAGLLHRRCQRWQISFISHLIWLAFLSASFVTTWLLLSTRQYDFVWETTILNSEFFISISQVLGALPLAFGFEVPNAQQVLDSRVGASPANPETLRMLWSNLLLSALALYGLLPRFIALLWTMIMRYGAWRSLKVDKQLPYYHQLLNRLNASSLNEGIVDADDGMQPPIKTSPLGSNNLLTLRSANNIHLGGLEWAGNWPPELNKLQLSDYAVTTVGSNATDRISRKNLKVEVAEHSSQPVILVGRLRASPDRGIIRYLSELCAKHRDLWLLLSYSNDDSANGAQWQVWAKALTETGINPSHVIAHKVLHD